MITAVPTRFAPMGPAPLLRARILAFDPVITEREQRQLAPAATQW